MPKTKIINELLVDLNNAEALALALHLDDESQCTEYAVTERNVNVLDGEEPEELT
jgi:hypothetical protein